MVYDHGSGLAAEAEYCLVAAGKVESITKHLLSQKFTSCNNVNELGNLVQKCAIVRMSLSFDESEMKLGETEAEIIRKYALLLSDSGLVEEAIALIPGGSGNEGLISLKKRLRENLKKSDKK